MLQWEKPVRRVLGAQVGASREILCQFCTLLADAALWHNLRLQIALEKLLLLLPKMLLAAPPPPSVTNSMLASASASPSATGLIHARTYSATLAARFTKWSVAAH